ncbi:WD40-repeat-containing domain protein, partial [Lenzites betulinus]
PQGDRIATASLDGDVFIWELSSQKVLYAYHGKVSVLSLKWDPNENNCVLCGMDSGYIACLSFSEGKMEVFGFMGHSYPVECLDVKHQWAATGAQHEVRVWTWVLDGECCDISRYTMFPHRATDAWDMSAELVEPHTSQQDEVQTVTVTSLNWTPSGTQLIATYLHHGIRVYSADTWHCVRNISVEGRIARADLTDDGRAIIVSNALTGFDLYSVESGKILRAFGHEVGTKRATPVKFIEAGNAVVGGTTVGAIVIWDIHS